MFKPRGSTHETIPEREDDDVSVDVDRLRNLLDDLPFGQRQNQKRKGWSSFGMTPHTLFLESISDSGSGSSAASHHRLSAPFSQPITPPTPTTPTGTLRVTNPDLPARPSPIYPPPYHTDLTTTNTNIHSHRRIHTEPFSHNRRLTYPSPDVYAVFSLSTSNPSAYVTHTFAAEPGSFSAGGGMDDGQQEFIGAELGKLRTDALPALYAWIENMNITDTTERQTGNGYSYWTLRKLCLDDEGGGFTAGLRRYWYASGEN